jgi:hypothetical protein
MRCCCPDGATGPARLVGRALLSRAVFVVLLGPDRLASVTAHGSPRQAWPGCVRGLVRRRIRPTFGRPRPPPGWRPDRHGGRSDEGRPLRPRWAGATIGRPWHATGRSGLARAYGQDTSHVWQGQPLLAGAIACRERLRGVTKCHGQRPKGTGVACGWWCAGPNVPLAIGWLKSTPRPADASSHPGSPLVGHAVRLFRGLSRQQ